MKYLSPLTPVVLGFFSTVGLWFVHRDWLDWGQPWDQSYPIYLLSLNLLTFSIGCLCCKYSYLSPLGILLGQIFSLFSSGVPYMWILSVGASIIASFVSYGGIFFAVFFCKQVKMLKHSRG